MNEKLIMYWHTMQANYPKKLPPTSWDTLNINYPVRKFPKTDSSSETIGREWKPKPEILPNLKSSAEQENLYSRDYNVTLNLLHSQTDQDYGYKIPEVSKFNKHTSCNDNLYVYPPSKQLADRIPAEKAHGTTEMRSSYTDQIKPCRLVTDKDQYKHPASLPLDVFQPELPLVRKEIEPLDTTYEGFEKYLDPYLSTNKLHHRPFTAHVLERISNSRDIQTYHTYSTTPWVRTQKPDAMEWWLPISKAESIYDREKFKESFREIRTHNRSSWVPRSFYSETKANFKEVHSRPEAQIHNYEEEVRSLYQRSIASLQTNVKEEESAVKHFYNTVNSSVGSRTPVCSRINQYFERNKKLESRNQKAISTLQ